MKFLVRKYTQTFNPNAGIKIADKPDSLLNRCPVYEILLADIDETPVDVFPPGKEKASRGYMLVIAGETSSNPALRAYRFLPDRKHAHFEDAFKDYQGVFHPGKYGVYKKMTKQEGVIGSPCMKQICRQFFEAEVADRVFRKEVLKDIQHLFAIEEKVKDLLPEDRVLCFFRTPSFVFQKDEGVSLLFLQDFSIEFFNTAVWRSKFQEFELINNKLQ